MKKIGNIAFILILSVNSIIAQNINSIENENDVIKFLEELELVRKGTKLTENGDIFPRPEDQALADSLKIKNWNLFDLNGDDIKDLIVFLRFTPNDGFISTFMKYPRLVVILSTPNGEYEKHFLGSDLFFGDAYFPEFVRNEKSALIILHKGEATYTEENRGVIIETDTLCYNFGGFLEYNQSPSNFKIKSFNYLEEPGMVGGGMEIDLDEDRKLTTTHFLLMPGTIDGTRFNAKEKTISPEQFKTLEDILNYFQLDNIKHNYGVTWTDDVTGNLLVHLVDDEGIDRILKIKDYGHRGTYGLRLLYKFIRRLPYEE